MKKKYTLIYFDSKTRQNFYLNAMTNKVAILETKSFFNIWYMLGVTLAYIFLRTIPLYIDMNLNILVFINLIVGVCIGLIIEHFHTIKVARYLDTQKQIKENDKINELMYLGGKQLSEHIVLLLSLLFFSIGCSLMLLVNQEKFLTFFLSIAMWTIFTISFNSIDFFNRRALYKKETNS